MAAAGRPSVTVDSGALMPAQVSVIRVMRSCLQQAEILLPAWLDVLALRSKPGDRGL